MEMDLSMNKMWVICILKKVLKAIYINNYANLEKVHTRRQMLRDLANGKSYKIYSLRDEIFICWHVEPKVALLNMFHSSKQKEVDIKIEGSDNLVFVGFSAFIRQSATPLFLSINLYNFCKRIGMNVKCNSKTSIFF